MDMEILEISPETVRIIPHAAIKQETVQAFQDQCLELLDSPARRIEIDLSRTSHIDSNGLGVLVGLRMMAKRRSKNVEIVEISSNLKPIIQLSKLDMIYGLK